MQLSTHFFVAREGPATRFSRRVFLVSCFIIESFFCSLMDPFPPSARKVKMILRKIPEIVWLLHRGFVELKRGRCVVVRRFRGLTNWTRNTYISSHHIYMMCVLYIISHLFLGYIETVILRVHNEISEFSGGKLTANRPPHTPTAAWGRERRRRRRRKAAETQALDQRTHQTTRCVSPSKGRSVPQQSREAVILFRQRRQWKPAFVLLTA